MCLIVDANRASLVFSSQPGPDFSPLWDWLNGPDGRLVYGGKLAEELVKVRHAASLLQELLRAGKAHLADRSKVDHETARLQGRCRSNDPHVLALARVTGARILCTRDDDLIADFTDRALLRPKGKVYQRAQHATLFSGKLKGHSRGCRRAPRQGKRRSQWKGT